MIEGRRVAAGEAILSGAATAGRNESERSRSGRTGEDRRSEDRRGEDRTDEAHRDAARSSAERTDEAIEALVRQHSRLVYRIAYAVLRSHHDAEDATQETFLRVLRYSSKLAAVDDPKTWLARIAWRVASDRGKRRGRTREISLDDDGGDGDPGNSIDEVASSDAAADSVVHGAQIGSALEKLIAALPDKLRQPLVLSTIEEMSPREVAATLGINEAAVRSRVFRARQILREKLEPRTSRK